MLYSMLHETPRVMPRIANSIVDLIGNTPLLRLPVEDTAPGVQILAKLESANPLASAKDRAALWMLRAAEAAGHLAPGNGTVIEATSDNTGIALATLSAARGYRCLIVLPDSATIERIELLRALGAEIVLTPGEQRYQGAVDRAEELHRDTPGSWFARHHENPDNIRAHREITGSEIWSDTGGRIDILVCSIGTAALCGAASFLKEHNPLLKAVAVASETSPPLPQGYPDTHVLPELKDGVVADTTERDLIDEVQTVSDNEALETTRWLARRVGVLSGISSGAAVHVAMRLARLPDNEGRTIVTVLPDAGERYLSAANASPGDSVRS
jgi:cysteine synthase